MGDHKEDMQKPSDPTKQRDEANKGSQIYQQGERAGQSQHDKPSSQNQNPGNRDQADKDRASNPNPQSDQGDKSRDRSSNPGGSGSDRNR